MDEAWRGKEPLPGLGGAGGRSQLGEGCADTEKIEPSLAIDLPSPSHLLGKESRC